MTDEASGSKLMEECLREIGTVRARPDIDPDREAEAWILDVHAKHKAVLLKFLVAYLDLMGAEDHYGEWVGLDLQGAAAGQLPSGAEIMKAIGKRGTLHLVRWTDERGRLAMVVTHVGVVGVTPDRLPTFGEVNKALDMWPKNVPAAIPLERAQELAIKILQSGPVRPAEGSGIVIVGG